MMSFISSQYRCHFSNPDWGLHYWKYER